MRIAVLALAGISMAAAANDVQAQALQSGRFTVTPIIGTIRWDDASALANKEANSSGAFTETKITPTVGMQADYHIRPQIGVGFYFEAARPTTRGDYFPSVLFNFGASLPAELRVVSQRVTVMMYGVQGTLGFGLGRLNPYVSGGGGAVTVNTDPQQSDGNNSYTTGQFQLGGGLGFQLGANTALRIDVRDFVFTSWDRNQLNPVRAAFQNTLFPSANGNPPEEKSTVHNLRIGIGFSFVPRRGGTADPDDSEQE
ncbi:MAG: outer membrane beta-barrel protein [Gemmatimonadaceae bacterium]